MSAQLGLLGLDVDEAAYPLDKVAVRAGKLPRYSLLFALFPERDEADRLAYLANDQRNSRRLTGKLLTSDRLHMTLLAVDEFIGAVPQLAVDAMLAAGSSVACSRFPITFDSALTFVRRQPTEPFVLRSDAPSDASIAGLRAALHQRMKSSGLKLLLSRTPHMTMLYDEQLVAAQSIAPITWTATRFALILSHVGQSHHQWIREWQLKP